MEIEMKVPIFVQAFLNCYHCRVDAKGEHQRLD